VKWSIDYKKCDGCIDEEVPLCEKYCPYGAIRYRKNPVVNKREKKE
jgi:Fe-S-cluster-containing hydrogenase component 2